MALTAIIEAELLDAIDTGTDPEAVIHRYQASKGPLYAALARATATAREQFDDVAMDIDAATTERKAVQSEVESLTVQVAQLHAERAYALDQQAALQQHLDQQHATLDQLKRLQALGFDPMALDHLATLFQELAANRASPCPIPCTNSSRRSRIMPNWLNSIAKWPKPNSRPKSPSTPRPPEPSRPRCESKRFRPPNG